MVTAAIARVNMTEILIDRGQWDDAEAILLDVLPLWKASRYRYYLAACLSLLGRAVLRSGRIDEALKHLEESKRHFLDVGAEQEVPAVEARIVECRIYRSETDAAFAMVNGLLGRAGSSSGVAKVVPLLERARALALAQRGDVEGARQALDAGLAAARVRRDVYEVTLTLQARIELDRIAGVAPPPDVAAECEALVARLAVQALPAMPPLKRGAD
jgi:tetratricopeptide (TPR) repeat protein